MDATTTKNMTIKITPQNLSNYPYEGKLLTGYEPLD